MARRGTAGPPGDQVLARVQRELARGWPPGLTVLTGDDLYHLDRTQRTLLDGLMPDGADEFALTVFGSEPIDVSKLVNAARTRGMFAPVRVVLLRELAALEGEPKPLGDFATNPPDGSYLLVRAPVLDRRRKLHKLLAGSGTLLSFSRDAYRTPRQRDAVVRALAQERELKLDRHVASFLAEVCQGDFHRVGNELDKLAAWSGEPDGSIGLEDARAVVGGSGALTGWEVADRLLVRDGAGALRAMRRLIQEGDEPIRILGGLASRARSMLQAKALLEGGARGKQIVDAARAWYFRDALFEGLERYTLDELMGFPGRLLEADRTLKSRSIDASAVMESLVRDLTGPRSSR